MTNKQLKQVEQFCKPYYRATGQWHAWDHVRGVQRLSVAIAEAEFPTADVRLIKAAAAIHDMGRTIQDEGHAEQSGKIAKPYLEAIGLSPADVATIIDAVVYHDVKRIDQAKTVEARIVFDADKIEILSVYGFMRVISWLIEERRMEMGRAVDFLWEYCDRFRDKLFSTYAKELVTDELKVLEQVVSKFTDYEKKWRKP